MTVMTAEAPTRSQLFALYNDTGKCLELRNMNDGEIVLTKALATSMLSRMRDESVDPSIVRQELLDLGATSKGEPRPTKPRKAKVDFQAVYDKAHQAGKAAAEAHTPTPMVVQGRANPLDDNSKVVEQYHVPQGVCGFAWIRFKGNTAWGRWTKKQNLSSKGYPSGLQIWVHEYGQSMELKEKYAQAFAKSLRDQGIDDAYPGSRMD